jgi:hypothetical protein
MEAIENHVCYSLWSLENRFILEEQTKGLEGNKALLNETNNITGNDAILWFAELFSFKAEKAVSKFQFENRINRMLEDIGDIESYIANKMYGCDFWDINTISEILYFENRASLIDKYLTFIKICQIICVSDQFKDSKILKVVQRCVKMLTPFISDCLLANLAVYFANAEQTSSNSFDSAMREIGHLYTIGQYEEVVQLCGQNLDHHADCLELYEYLVKSLLYLGQECPDNREGSIKNDLLRVMYQSYIKPQDVIIDAYYKLGFYARIFNGTNFGISLYSFMVNRFSIDKDDNIQKMSELNSRHRSARFCLLYDDVIKKHYYLFDYQTKHSDFAQTRLFIHYYNQVAKNGALVFLKDIPDSRLELYDVIAKINNNEHLDVQQHLKKLYLSYNPNRENKISAYYYERVLILLFNLYIETDQRDSCLELYISNYFENEYLARRLNRKRLFQIIQRDPTDGLKTKIGLPILTHIYDPNNVTELFTACANFLDLNSCNKPSEIFELDRFKDSKSKEIVYFLRYVCTPAVMESMYWVFTSFEEANNERIEICNILRKIDPSNDGVYVTEISQITQRNSLAQRIKILDESRIDFDLANIRKSKKELVSENYKRYIEIGNFDFSYEVLDINNSHFFVLNYELSKIVAAKKNQMYSILKDIFQDYRDEFAFGQHGLDSSLSTCIRHGKLQNHIRKVFEQYHLINLKENYNSHSYLPDENIAKIFVEQGFDKRFINGFNNIISNFSKQVDDAIDEINTSLIRIKTEKLNPKGMFDLSFNDQEMLSIFSESKLLNSEELLLDYFDKVLMIRIEKSLHLIQEYMTKQFKQQLVEYINSLESSVMKLFEKDNDNMFFLEIKQQIANCRTLIQVETNNIAKWFILPKKQDFSDFTVQQLIETSVAISKKLYTSFDDCNVQINNSTTCLVKGNTFSHFVEVFVLLFTNAVIHSGFSNDLKKLKIEVDVHENEKFMIFTICNNLSDEVDIDAVKHNIEQVEKKICDSENIGKYFRYEGGSGYVKIAKMLNYNISTPWQMKLNVDQDRRYCVNLKVGK